MKEEKGIAISEVLITHELKYQTSHTVYTILCQLNLFKHTYLEYLLYTSKN